MFTDLATFRNDVKNRLTPLLPSGWKCEATLEGTIKSLTPVLYIEFTEVDTLDDGGQPLGQGQALARFRAIITDPKTDTEKAENAVDEYLPRILGAFDKFDDIAWKNAEKRRLEDGPMAWSIQAFGFVSTASTTP